MTKCTQKIIVIHSIGIAALVVDCNCRLQPNRLIPLASCFRNIASLCAITVYNQTAFLLPLVFEILCPYLSIPNPLIGTSGKLPQSHHRAQSGVSDRCETSVSSLLNSRVLHVSSNGDHPDLLDGEKNECKK